MLHISEPGVNPVYVHTRYKHMYVCMHVCMYVGYTYLHIMYRMQLAQMYGARALTV